jgi:hypothetical protein
MDEQELIQIIDGQGKRIARRRWNCPSDSKIASYLEHRLEAKDKSRVEAHLANCDFCLGAVAALVRQQRASEPVEVTAPLLRKAIDLVPLKTVWTLSWKWLLAPALASVVLITALLQRSPQPERFGRSVPASAVEAERSAEEIPQTSSRPPEKQYVRKKVAIAPGLQLVEPKLNSAWQKEALRFRWRSVANATYYEVRVVNSEGDLVWHGQESDLSTRFPPDLPLRPGKYFVWVRAYLNDGRTIKSDARAFWIRSSG